MKHAIFALLFILLLAPALQAKLQWFEEKPLTGAFVVAPHPELRADSLLAGRYQPRLERYLEDRLGFRPLLIRLRNQLSFSFFGLSRTTDVIIGRRGILFEPRHIESYSGHDLLDQEEVRFRVRRLRAIQRDLAKRGVVLLFVMAPNKARFQPEDLPAAMRPRPGTLTNYELYVRAMQADTVALLDMVPLFAQWKDTSRYPLFPKGGTHWSGYGASLAADTLLRRLEYIGNLRLPAVRAVGPPRIVHSTDSLRGSDKDLVDPLNLLQKLEATPLAYPRLVIDAPQTGQVRPPTLFVSDSFTWGLAQFTPYIVREFSDDTRVWYYGYGIHIPDSTFRDTGVICQSLDLQKEIESRRLIVVLLTEHNLPTYEFDFTRRVYQLYHPFSAADEAAINQLSEKLMAEANAKDADAVWREQAKDAAGYAQRIRNKAEELYERQATR
ncbi:hypothetical protein DNI29_14305 [Hymenobacter sediminis]|uniref:alginate O-acetyltransferase AlgX-related protein n=1 Tax=Hymenobacter sediminis TaxID=2218621 RepID=UPI000DA6A33E|nr:hypothetical protein [Hymenobacter sediminis]RPD46175.1 hypothetical protein DNI29_14305 [Hymenobacter sediminis]